MKTDVTDVSSGSQRHSERLNRAVQVLVIDGVLVVPNLISRVSYLVSHKPDAIVAWIRLDLGHRRARTCPGHDGRLHSRSATEGRKCEIGCAADLILAVGGAVVHVALPGMRLAPGVFTRGDILRFGEIGRAYIERCIEVVHFHENPVRHAVVHVAGMVIRIR